MGPINPIIDDSEFARRIRAARAYLGMNLSEAGERLGLSAHRLSRRERADSNGMQLSVADRFHIAAVYCELTGWPIGFFTDQKIPVIPLPGSDSDEEELSPREIVDRVDREEDDGDAAAH